jgi:hypothetical protein
MRASFNPDRSIEPQIRAQRLAILDQRILAAISSFAVGEEIKGTRDRQC